MTYNYFVYILQCFSNGKHFFYRGRTNNFKRRYHEHKNGKCKYTRRFKGNIHPVYLELYQARNQKEGEKWSVRREKQIKKWSRNKVNQTVNINKRKLHELINTFLN